MKKISLLLIAMSSLHGMEQTASKMRHILPSDTNQVDISGTVNSEINLSNKGLQDLKSLEDIKDKDAIITIDLSGNTLTELPQNAFSAFENLKFLYLNKNQIAEVHEDAFKGLLYLTEVHIVGNPIQNLPDTLFACFELPTIITRTNDIDV